MRLCAIRTRYEASYNSVVWIPIVRAGHVSEWISIWYTLLRTRFKYLSCSRYYCVGFVFVVMLANFRKTTRASLESASPSHAAGPIPAAKVRGHVGRAAEAYGTLAEYAIHCVHVDEVNILLLFLSERKNTRGSSWCLHIPHRRRRGRCNILISLLHRDVRSHRLRRLLQWTVYALSRHLTRARRCRII